MSLTEQNVHSGSVVNLIVKAAPSEQEKRLAALERRGL